MPQQKGISAALRFTDPDRKKIVDHWLKRSISIGAKQAAHESGVSWDTLFRWKKKFYPKG